MDELESGSVDPLQVHYQFKCIEKIIEEMTSTKDGNEIAKRYKQLVLDAAEKYGQKEFTFSNSKIKIGEVGSKYDYSKCGDTELAEWNQQAAELKVKIDARQKMLQTVPEKGMTIVTEAGEGITVYRPAKSSTTAVIVTLK